MSVNLDDFDRERSTSFGRIAELYDRARPSYPKALVDDLMAAGPADVLDVGCGTGKAGRLLAARGAQVVGVEPDPRMAEVARRHGLRVEHGRFEDWEPGGRTFDLIVSGQAWHWIDPDTGIPKTAALLRPGGALALFWNREQADEEVRPRIHEVYARLAPAILERSAALGRPRPDRDDAALLEASGRFATVTTKDYRWSSTLTTAQWIDRLRTHSDHVLLEPEIRNAILTEVAAVVDAAGGTLRLDSTTNLILASAPTGQGRR